MQTGSEAAGTLPAPIAELIKGLRRICAATADERSILVQVGPLAQRAAADLSWLSEAILRPDPGQGFSLFPLHEEPDHTLAVFALSWLPGRGTPPHDHNTWAVVAGVQGPETNTFWKRLDDGSRPGYAELEKMAVKVFGPGHVMTMPTGTVHSVVNDSAEVSVSLHIYGKHINHTGRHQFDPEQKTATRYINRIEEPPVLAAGNGMRS
jgi:predicted metal-dependent enzyme (double-stranded beta helix superfamily)